MICLEKRKNKHLKNKNLSGTWPNKNSEKNRSYIFFSFLVRKKIESNIFIYREPNKSNNQ